LPQVTRAQKVRLGIFIGAGLTVLIGGLLILAGSKLGEKRDAYLVRFREAGVSLNGLDVGSPVKYSGIRVGRVEGVRIDPDNVSVILVELSIDHRTPIAEDTKADLGSQGITGLKYIELTRGSAGARVRQPGEEIPSGTSLFDTLGQSAESIAKKVETVLDRVADLTGPDQKDRIARVLERTESLLATLDGVLTENRESLKTLAEQVDILATELARTAKGANALLGEATLLVKNAKATPERLNAFLEQGAGVLAESRITFGAVNAVLAQTKQQLIEAVGLVREAAENASAFTQKLREDPSLLLRGASNNDEGE
jgi:phospholipid/cholesterol/gamma-HCH transport system substrate-binding protein